MSGASDHGGYVVAGLADSALGVHAGEQQPADDEEGDEGEDRGPVGVGDGQDATVTMTHQLARPNRIVRLAPQRPARRPKMRAPPKATNCTIRIVAIRISCGCPSSSAPNTDAEAITVWMPSLKNR